MSCAHERTLHCHHPARLFRGWIGCCHCKHVAVLMEKPEGGFVEIEEKTHGFPGSAPSPLLTSIDRKVIDELRAREDNTTDYVMALDLASFVEALDRKLASPIVVVRR